MAGRRRVQGNRKKAVAYVRVSTDRQKLSPEAQRAAIGKWAKRSGVAVVAWCEDIGVSGARDPFKRHGMAEAFKALREHRAGHLVVAVRDRLARDVYGAAAINYAVRDAGAEVTAVDGHNGNTSQDLLIQFMSDWVAQLEREKISQRRKAARMVSRKQGKYDGGDLAYGDAVSRDGKRIIKDRKETAVIRRVVALRRDGLTFRAIADELQAQGLRPRNGKRWQPMTVKRICDRAS